MELIRKYKQGKLTSGDLRNLNNIVICLMVLVATFSIIWSIALHMLSGDFYDGIISAKIVFKDRDIARMDNRSREIFNKDLLKVGALPKDIVTVPQSLKSDEESSTKKPKFQFAHIYEPKDYAPVLARLISQQEQKDTADTTTTVAPTTNTPTKIVFDPQADHQFLSTQTIDTHATRWSTGVGAQFVYAFPVISEIVAIIWTSMCLIFQTGNKKMPVLPKPWRIVVPSIIIFSLMSMGSIAYTILTNGYLKRLCINLRQGLTNPLAVSCGDAIALLRPHIREHSVSHDAYLNLFRCSYIISMILWILALLVMVLRCVFAVDFQLVDIDEMFEHPTNGAQQPTIQPVYRELRQYSPQHGQTEKRPKSEEDYQSAKSRLSDLAIPLLELKNQQSQQTHGQLASHLTT